MKIGIIGAGSIGLLFSWYLSRDHEVTLYTRTAHQADQINREGVTLIKKCEIVRMLPAKPMELWAGGDDLTIITVKQYQLEDVLSRVKEMVEETGCLLFLQNGMGHLELIEQLHASTIYVGSVEHGAARVSATVVRHNGVGPVRAAVYKGSKGFLVQLANGAPKDFPIIIEEDYYEILVKKLVVNAVINPLTAAFQIQNGLLLGNPFFQKIAISLFDEIMSVIGAVNKEEHYRNVVTVCENTSANYSSMYIDIGQGRRTEIDAILGFLLEEAERKQIQCPYIRNYFQVIKGKEFQGEGQT